MKIRSAASTPRPAPGSRQLATALRLRAGSFDLRSNKAGIAISAEVTLHHERSEPGPLTSESTQGGSRRGVYIQVSQPAFGGDTGGAGQGHHQAELGWVASGGVLIRTCRGRRDYVGGLNHFVSLTMLDDVDALSDRVRRIAPDLHEAEAA